jgi:hypothetical protein
LDLLCDKEFVSIVTYKPLNFIQVLQTLQIW